MNSGEKNTFPAGLSLTFNINPGFKPYPGYMAWYRWTGTYVPQISMSAGYFALGGNKQSTSAHPVFWCKPSDLQEKSVPHSFNVLVNDILMSLSENSGSDGNYSASAFAYISARNDSLKLDTSIGYSPPVQHTLRTQTWSFVNNDTKSKPLCGRK